ncbi:MAG: ABC transporter ATP-binding protein [Lachnospiraceae bacterium]|nr:ABC transporter ATP-binding protein [Lachnospiraceae bacterium]
MEEMIIQAKGVERAYPLPDGEVFYALKKIDMEIPKGKLTIFRGKSGSGKTTLMNLLGALDQPTAGEIILDQQVITKMNEEECGQIRRKNIGFVFQSVALIPIMSAYENVEYALRLSGYEGDYETRVQECLKMVGLGSRMNHMPQEMSGGEQQRVAIARAIAHKPGIVFADEPTAELDTNTGLQVVKIFKDLVEQEGVTIVMTTHDVGLMEVGDKVFELEDGEIINAE